MLGRHPPTKRHTKPCKFFQTSRCPLSAQECDFAHVLLEENVPQRQNAICRYYAAGSCGNGPKCRYRHGVEHSEERKASRLPDMRGVEPLYNQNPHSLIGSNASPASIPPFHSPYHTMYPASPGAWVPYRDSYPPVYSPDAIPIAQFYKPSVVASSHSGDSSGSASTSARSSLSDDVVFVTDDPKYNEHSHQHQSQIRITEERRPVVHIPPFYPSKNAHVSVSPVSPIDGHHPAHSHIHASPILNSPVSPVHPPRLRSRSNSRYKTSNYKTKLCKHFSTHGACPNGDECTFIHEEPLPTTTQNLKAPPGLPPKPTSQQEENRKRNFFPVSWRVIGGGVVIGDLSRRRDSSASSCRSYSADAPASKNGGSPEWSDNAEEDYAETRSNRQSDSYSGSNSVGSSSVAGSKPLRRPRSTSIPPASRSVQKSLFSAESPGSL